MYELSKMFKTKQIRESFSCSLTSKISPPESTCAVYSKFL